MPVAGRGGFALVCAGIVSLLSSWIFSAGVATLVVARHACGLDCPQALVFTAMSVAAAAVTVALVSSVSMLLLSSYVLDHVSREHMAAATREAMDDGKAFVVAKVTCVVLALLGLIAFFVKVYPPLRGSNLARVGSAAIDSGALCVSTLYCFIVVTIFAIRMLKHI